MTAHKIIEGIKQAIAGNISAVTIEGQRWVRKDHTPANPYPNPVAWGRVVDGKAVTVSLEWTPANDEPLYAALSGALKPGAVERLEQLLKLTFNDGEYVGRRSKEGMPPAELIELRDGTIAERLRTLRAIAATPAQPPAAEPTQSRDAIFEIIEQFHRNASDHDEALPTEIDHAVSRILALIPAAEQVTAEPVARAHITLEDDGPYATLEVLNGELLQPSMSPVDLYATPADQVAVKALEPFAEAAEKAIVSGRPPVEFVGAADFESARTALSTIRGGKHE